MENLDQKIKEFGDYILQTPEFIEFKKAAEKLEKDKDAMLAIQDVQDRAEAIYALEESDSEVSDEQRQGLNEAQAKMMANEIEICELMSEAKPLMSGFLIMQRGVPVAHLSHPYMSEGRKMVCKVIRFDKDSEGVSKGIIVPDPIRL